MIPDSLAAAALDHAARVLGTLTPAQLDDLATGRGRLEFRRADGPRAESTRSGRRADPLSPSDEVAVAVAAINRLTSRAEVDGYLRRRGFTAAVLKEIARSLGPTVDATPRTKADLARNIVEGTAGFRERSMAMSGGAWS